jgi:hypothetical protein
VSKIGYKGTKCFY